MLLFLGFTQSHATGLNKKIKKNNCTASTKRYDLEYNYCKKEKKKEKTNLPRTHAL